MTPRKLWKLYAQYLSAEIVNLNLQWVHNPTKKILFWCLLPYVKQIASLGLMHETGCSGLVHWDDPEGWDGQGGGRGVQDGEHMYTHGWFMSMYGKNHYNIVK